MTNVEKVTTSFITKSLEDYGYSGFKISEVLVEKLTGGYLGEVLRVKIKYSERGDSSGIILPDSVVCKFHPTRFFDQKLHVRETMFYKEFSDEEYFPFLPKYYSSILDLETGKGVIIMEDIHDMDVLTFVEGVSINHLQIIFDCMAKIHARYWNKKEYVQKKFDEYGLSLKEKGEKLLLKDLFQKWVNNEKKMEEFSDEIKRNMRLASKNMTELMMKIYEKLKNRTITHSDLWNNNILFPINSEKIEDGRVVKILDFQFCDFSAAQEDLAFILCSSVKKEDLIQNERSLIQFYYNRLKFHFLEDESNNNKELEYSLDDCLEDYELCKIYGVIFTLASYEVFNEETRERMIYSINSFFKDDVFLKLYKKVGMS